IAIQGVCHTVVAFDAGGFDVDTSAATLAVTTGLEAGREVNLEKSLRLADRIGGHLVSGHVDGTGTVAAFEDLGGSWRLAIDAPAPLARYIALKGSIAVDGVSLTVNAVEGARFEINVIPHTRAVTTLGRLSAGAAVNLEVDMTARYLERLMAAGGDGPDGAK
ncbi:MAG TPA: riboflavin synthase, partial [Usitatibacteraceae bacterium]|nr:riboflavin synthase [Usitatibacteraceae bacterium]